jgi:hypothetical protein
LTYESCNESHKFDAFLWEMAQEMGVPLNRVKKELKKGWG